MNMMSNVVPCVDTLTKTLREEMGRIWRSHIYATDDERCNALKQNFASHQFVQGTFFSEEGKIVFKGNIGDCKTEITCSR
jgi:hypothetical protein